MWPLRKDQEHPWAAPPARPIRYDVWQRLADWYNGRRDGRLGLPSVPTWIVEIDQPTDLIGESGNGVGTLRLAELTHHYRGAMEGERRDFLAFRESMSSQVNEAVQRLGTAVARLADLRTQVDRARQLPSAEALGRRRFAEAQHDSELVRQRRLADHGRRLHELEQRYAAAETALGQARQIVDTHQLTIQARWYLVRVRVRRLYEHAHRRTNVYWRQLVRHHPQGDLLNGLLATVGPDLPGWVSEAMPPPVADSHSDAWADADHPTRSHQLHGLGDDHDPVVASPTTTAHRDS